MKPHLCRSWILLALLAVPTSLYAGYFDASVDLMMRPNNVMHSAGYAAYYDSFGNLVWNERLVGNHKIDPIAYRPVQAVGQYFNSVAGTGIGGQCYRARLTITAYGASNAVPDASNAWGSFSVCVPAPPPPPPVEPPCDETGGDLEDGYGGDCTDSPILLDLWGGGFELTDVPVAFDLNADGVAEQTLWTKAHSGVAFLALDRNGNGMIDSGAELFGNNTLLKTGEKAVYGYIALAEFDLSYNGGNFDAYISPEDTIWPSLRLWLDDNHNGISEPDELQTLDQAGVLKMEYDYKIMWKQDRFGNVFRAMSKAWIENRHGKPHQRKTYDVFFLRIGN